MNLTEEQQIVLDGILKWAKTKSTPVAILTGGAGTGKTTLLKYVVDELRNKKIAFELLAPTGRAARILGQKTDSQAKTIHSEIYQLGDIKVEDDTTESDQLGFDVSGFVIPFVLKKTDPGKTIFIVDEASMISDTYSGNELLSFGTGRLLHDLLHYSRIFNSRLTNTKILFVGDVAQLPPINSKDSPALSGKYFLYEYRLNPDCFNLTTVLRQSEGSLILKNSETIRNSISNQNFSKFNIEKDKFSIFSLSEDTAIKSLLHEYDPAEKIIITVSNKKALTYNRIIREYKYSTKHLPIQVGDTLLVCRNSIKHNFFNGDLIKVLEIGETSECKSHKLRGSRREIKLYFRNIVVQHIDGEDKSPQQCKVFENILDNTNINMSAEEHQAIMFDFRQRHPSLEIDSEEFKSALMKDEYFNALVVKYGYAITCNKAQGGEWSKVIVNFEWWGRNQGFFRWAYTAITRSKHFLGVVNDPVFGVNETIIPHSDHDDLLINHTHLIKDETCVNNELVRDEKNISPTNLLPAQHGAKWNDQALYELFTVWENSKKKYFSILEISDEIGRTPLAILIQLYRANKLTLTQADDMAHKCHCAKLVSEAAKPKKPSDPSENL